MAEGIELIPLVAPRARAACRITSRPATPTPSVKQCPLRSISGSSGLRVILMSAMRLVLKGYG